MNGKGLWLGPVMMMCFFLFYFVISIFKNGMRQPFYIEKPNKHGARWVVSFLFFLCIFFICSSLWHLYHFLWHINTTKIFRQFYRKNNEVVTCSRCLRRFNRRCHRPQARIEGGGKTEEEEGGSTATKNGIWPSWRDRKVLPLCWYDVSTLSLVLWNRLRFTLFPKLQLLYCGCFLFSKCILKFWK